MEYLKTTDKSLNNWTFPVKADLAFAKLLQKRAIPCKFFGNYLILLARKGQSRIILVRKIKAVL